MSKKRILICDDEEGIRESLNLILKEDYELSFCFNGQECFERIEKGEQFDMVLMDIKMPRASGLDTLRKIKEKKPQQKVIIITGYRSFEMAQETISAGACDYIVKPFSSKDILESAARNIS